MTLPVPELGLVVSYAYLWNSEEAFAAARRLRTVPRTE